MKNIILYIAFLLLISFKKERDLNCDDFHTGKFELISKADNRKYHLERKENFQSEETFDLKTNKKIGNKRVYNIKWINNCEYSLMIDTLKSEFDENDLYINANGGLKCRIIKIYGKSAKVITSFEKNSVESLTTKMF